MLAKRHLIFTTDHRAVFHRETVDRIQRSSAGHSDPLASVKGSYVRHFLNSPSLVQSTTEVPLSFVQRFHTFRPIYIAACPWKCNAVGMAYRGGDLASFKQELINVTQHGQWTTRLFLVKFLEGTEVLTCSGSRD
jgi:hypothetical protein